MDQPGYAFFLAVFIPITEYSGQVPTILVIRAMRPMRIMMYENGAGTRFDRTAPRSAIPMMIRTMRSIIPTFFSPMVMIYQAGIPLSG
jgi:hypothetical protein